MADYALLIRPTGCFDGSMPTNFQCHGLNCTSSELIDAHIIPAGFGRLIRGEGPNMSISLEKTTEARPHLGEFDRQILCGNCDHKLGKFDDYAIDVCRTFQRKHRSPTAGMFEFSNFDGQKFAKFVLAVLWRASISKRKNYEKIQLGFYENIARDILFDQTPLSVFGAFEVTAHRYTSKYLDMEGIYSLPVRTKVDETNFYWFSLSGFRITAKVDSRPFKPKLRPFVINNTDVMRGLFLEFEDTQEFQRVKQIAVNALKRGDR